MKMTEVQCSMRAMKESGEIGKRIRRLRSQLLDIGSQEEFAAKLGDVTRGAVGNWERGKGIKQTNIQRISDTFDVSYEWLATGRGEPFMGTSDTPLTKSRNFGLVPVRGKVAGGTFQEVESWGVTDMTEYVPSSGDYPTEWQYAFVVNGESINRVAADGDRLICVDLIQSGVDIHDGDLVIVERRKYNDGLVERTAKRVRMTMRGPELWPESNHPEHQEAIVYEPDGDTDHNSVKVIAKVLWVLRKP